MGGGISECPQTFVRLPQLVGSLRLSIGSPPRGQKCRTEIEALVPVYDSYLATLGTVTSLIKSQALSSITVSVNHPSGSREDFLSLEDLDRQVKVSLQDSDLGLYGNFRFLAGVATKPWLIICAIDDHLPSRVIDGLAEEKIPRDTNLVIFQQQVWEQVRDSTGRYHMLELSHSVADLEFSHGSKVNWDPVEPPPSWIFGLWRTSFFDATFPRSDFNWPDTYLVSSALFTNSVRYFESGIPASIGFVPGRPPHAVGSSWTNPFGWLLHMALLARRSPRKPGFRRLVSNWRLTLFFKRSFPRAYRALRLIKRIGRQTRRAAGSLS